LIRVVLRYAAAALALAVALAPVWWLLTIAVKREVDQFAFPPKWLWFTPTLEHFADAFLNRNFGRYMWNSTVVAVSSTAVSMLLGVPAAYGLARMRDSVWRERAAFWVLSTRMLPPIVTVVPLFLMMRDAGLLDSPLTLILVYSGFNLPFVVWMMRGFLEEIPIEIEHAARIDGDTRLGALIRVILPLSAPGLAATAVFCIIVAWNEFLFAFVMTQTEASMTLPVGIASRVTQYEIRWGAMSAAGAVALAPVLLFAAAVQRHLVRGLSLGAVKG
jgi:multiple sugar transport system permease protein